ncbi:unnamed protein product [Prunus armeniaca]
MSKQHILAILYPAQGHVIPSMELSQCLANHGFKVTFVNTEHNHKRVMNALADESHISKDHIHLVSIPDGLEPLEDRNELGRLSEAMQRVMPGKLEELIEKINQGEGQKITCVIADQTSGWILEVAEKMKIRRVAFYPAAAAVLAITLSIPKLIHEGIINNDGIAPKGQMFQLAPNMPIMKTEPLLWSCIGDLTTHKIIFQALVRSNKTTLATDWLLCNSTYDLEPAAFTLAPEILPIPHSWQATGLGIQQATSGHKT